MDWAFYDRQINDARLMDIIMDVLSEKGFQVSMDDHVTIIPTRVDLNTGTISHEE
jgi:adenylate kinase